MQSIPSPAAIPDPTAQLTAAKTVARTERRKLVDEQQAFEQFRDELARVTPTTHTPMESSRVLARQETGIDALCSAYRSTVMSVPHYTAEYDEPLRASLANEFSADVAAAVTTASRLSPHLKGSIEKLTAEAIGRRKQLVQVIDEERVQLDKLREQLNDACNELESLLDQPLDTAEFNTLQSTRSRLQSLRENCATLVDDRQDQLLSFRCKLAADIDDVADYLYEDLDEIHPVLSLVAALVALIEQTRTGIEARLAAPDV